DGGAEVSAIVGALRHAGDRRRDEGTGWVEVPAVPGPLRYEGDGRWAEATGCAYPAAGVAAHRHRDNRSRSGQPEKGPSEVRNQVVALAWRTPLNEVRRFLFLFHP